MGCRSTPAVFGREFGEDDMILPVPGDLEIAASEPLDAEANAFGEPNASMVGGDDVGLDAVKAEPVGEFKKRVCKEGAQGFKGVAATDGVGTEPPTGVGVLERAADDVVEVEHANAALIVVPGAEAVIGATGEPFAGAGELALKVNIRGFAGFGCR